MGYETWIAIVFLIGYLFIIFEQQIKFDKAAAAILTGIICWSIYLSASELSSENKLAQLNGYLAEISQILFYLMGAMLIVGVIEVHDGFEIISQFIRYKSPLIVLCLIMLLAFFLSAILDNLATCIVMVTILKKLIPNHSQRILLSGGIIFAVNAGGAWTPIGDVTTTMLWIENKITSWSVISTLFLPSLISLCVFTALLFLGMDKSINLSKLPPIKQTPVGAKTVLAVGLFSLMLPPLLKTLFELPPFLGIFLGVTLLWALTDFMHLDVKERDYLRLYNTLAKLDMQCILFFFGILLSVDALDAANLLKKLSTWLDAVFINQDTVVIVMGILSSFIGNVPFVAVAIKLYDPSVFPQNHYLWNLIAYCAGIGGSILIIGSAPGIALMSLEKVSFFWYARRITWMTLVAYLAGVIVFYALM